MSTHARLFFVLVGGVVHVASIVDAFLEIVAFGLSVAFGAARRRIAGLTWRKILRNQRIAFPRDLNGDD
ncbi:hypothetical protein ACE10Z_06830 [Bradyrhizobium sp. Pha-3]|uniref:hypothetical protein n=1 Tax=Bradyrhizobium sp. Pha-3 TaxID=208375 RepID=UPI0035D4301A